MLAPDATAMNRSRRVFLVAAAAFSLSAPTRSAPRPSPGDAYSDKDAADEWIRRWMQTPGAVAGALHLGRFADRMYFVTREIGWRPNPGQRGANVVVPAGFVTELASIPRMFWSAFPPDGPYAYAAVIHDYLYWEQPLQREEADRIFRLAMEDFKIARVTIDTLYGAVRSGGGTAWRSNASLKAAGERRVLRKYPDDPTTRWADWKRMPGVF
jgi:hypothetical protein